jgi:hypothetical protein
MHDCRALPIRMLVSDLDLTDAGLIEIDFSRSAIAMPPWTHKRILVRFTTAAPHES